MIELVIAGVLGAGLLAGSAWSYRRTKEERLAFAAANGLRVTELDRMRGDDVEIHFTERSSGKTRTTFTVVTFAELNVPRDFGLGKEGLFASDDWQLGDVAFDRAVRLRGDRRYLAYALGEEQRSLLLSLIDPWKNAAFELKDGTLTLRRDGHDLEETARLLDAGRALAAHFSAPKSARRSPLMTRATTDPLSEVRAAAVEALHAGFADAFAAVLPTLRQDDAAQVRFSVALATKDARDVRAVPLAKLSDAQRRSLWDRYAGVLDAQQVRRLVALSEVEVDAALYARAIVATDATPLLVHKFEAVRLEAVRWLGDHGGVADVPALRAVEKSSVFARAQVKACRAAIAAIQTRAGVVEAAGAVSLGEDLAGAMSDSEDEA